MFELIFLIAVSIYFIQSIVFIIGTQKKFPKLNEDELPVATVIVAARNEEDNIINCMNSLDKLIYPKDKLEIIIVDDNSTDATSTLIDDFIKDKPKFKKVSAKKEFGKLKGKANALANAIEIASGEIILTTDADCCVAQTWAKTIASYYQKDVALVNGFTYQDYFNNFSGIQNLDFIYLLTVASGTINLNKPLSCIGNNMSYRKSVYDEIGGYQNLPFSVTEDFNLLFAMHNLKKYKIIYPLDKDALVVSKPCSSLKQLYRQKKRWGVGGLKSPLRGYLIMGTGFVTHLCFLFVPLMFSSVALYLIAFKVMTDYFFLSHILKKLKIYSSLKYFLSFEFYYIVYVLALPFVLFFNRKVVWKERNF